jgi:hypothetical protein
MKYSNESLKQAISESLSWAEVERKLTNDNCKPSGSRQVSFKKRAVKAGYDFSHFTGQAHAKGKSYLNSKNIKQKYSDEEMFCNPSYVSRTTIRSRLMKDDNFINQCEICKNIEWNGKKIPLVLDHINGDKLNQKRENLRFICPNCDALTDTYKGKNIKRHNVTDLIILNMIPKCYTCCEVCRKLGIAVHGNNNIRIKNLMKHNNIKFKSRSVKIYKCVDCDSYITRSAKRCKSCESKIKGFVNSKCPSKDELEKIIWKKPTTSVAKDFGVSDNAINNWCKKYNIEKPPMGYWQRISAGMTHEEALNPTPKKETNPILPLSEDDVKQIHILLKGGNLTLRKIGEMFNRSHWVIIQIRDFKGHYSKYKNLYG